MTIIHLLLGVSERARKATVGISEQAGLTPSQAKLLLQLARDAPLTQRSLAHACATTPRNVTALVDALTQAGLAARKPHPRDRRAVLVSPTSEGRALAERLDERLEVLSRRALDALSPEALATLVQALKAIDAELTSEREGIR